VGEWYERKKKKNKTQTACTAHATSPNVLSPATMSQMAWQHSFYSFTGTVFLLISSFEQDLMVYFKMDTCTNHFNHVLLK
jgi:hypothetical protein